MAQDRKEQILAAAYEIVGVEGLEGLHARSVAAKVGINHAAVHYYYPRRTDLLAAAAAYAMRRFQSDRAKIAANATTSAAKIEGQMAQIEAYGKPASRFSKNWVSFFVAAIGDEAVRAQIAMHLTEWTESLRVEIDRGSKTGAVSKNSPFINPELLVATFLGAMLMAQCLGTQFDLGDKLDLISSSLLA